MGAWGVEPWDNDEASDWFADFFRGVDFDKRLETAFQVDDEYDRIRAAGYLLQVLGQIYIWPGDVDKLRLHLDRAIRHLKAMVDPEKAACQELQDMWGENSELFDSIRSQITELEQRRSQFKNE